MRLPLVRRSRRAPNRDPSEASISESLRALRLGGRLSLARGPGALTEHYIQVIRAADAYLVDIRDGSADQHFQTALPEVTDVERVWFAWMRRSEEWRSLAQWDRY